MQKNQAAENRRVRGGFQDRVESPSPSNRGPFVALLGLQRSVLGGCKHRFGVLALIGSRLIPANSVVWRHARLCCDDRSCVAHRSIAANVSGHPTLSCAGLQAFTIPLPKGKTSRTTLADLPARSQNAVPFLKGRQKKTRKESLTTNAQEPVAGALRLVDRWVPRVP